MKWLRRWWARIKLERMGYCSIHMMPRTNQINGPHGTTSWYIPSVCPGCIAEDKSRSEEHGRRAVALAEELIARLARIQH